MLFSISPFSKDYPNVMEALQAKREVEIIEQQGLGLFNSRPVMHVLSHIFNKHSGEHSQLFTTADVFYYGYILGKRAERKRNHERNTK